MNSPNGDPFLLCHWPLVRVSPRPTSCEVYRRAGLTEVRKNVNRFACPLDEQDGRHEPGFATKLLAQYVRYCQRPAMHYHRFAQQRRAEQQLSAIA